MSQNGPKRALETGQRLKQASGQRSKAKAGWRLQTGTHAERLPFVLALASGLWPLAPYPLTLPVSGPLTYVVPPAGFSSSSPVFFIAFLAIFVTRIVTTIVIASPAI